MSKWLKKENSYGIQLLQFLVIELGKEAGFLPLKPNMNYPIWTTYHVPEETPRKLAAMLAFAIHHSFDGQPEML